MALPYKMEIVEGKEEGGFVVSFPDALPVAKLWRVQLRMQWMQRRLD